MASNIVFTSASTSLSEIFLKLFKANRWKPVSLKEYNLIQDLTRYLAIDKLSTVADIFSVQQGIRTGNNNIFKIPKSEYLKLEDNEKIYFRPVIENNSIKDGFLKEGDYVWFPYDKSGMTISTEEELANNANHYFAHYLSPNKDILEKRAGITKWWELTRPRTWQFENTKKLVSTEFGNSSSFAFDKEGNYVVERGYAWQPRKKFTDDDYYFYLALFSSPFFNKLISIYSKELAGGHWYDLGKNRTKNIPIPDVHLDEVKNAVGYVKLADLGKRLSEGDSYVKAVLNDALSIYYPRELF